MVRNSNFYSLLCKIPHVTKVMFFSETAKCYITVPYSQQTTAKLITPSPYNLKKSWKSVKNSPKKPWKSVKKSPKKPWKSVFFPLCALLFEIIIVPLCLIYNK